VDSEDEGELEEEEEQEEQTGTKAAEENMDSSLVSKESSTLKEEVEKPSAKEEPSILAEGS